MHACNSFSSSEMLFMNSEVNIATIGYILSISIYSVAQKIEPLLNLIRVFLGKRWSYQSEKQK